MKYIVIIISIFLCTTAVYAQTDRLSKLLPKDTELTLVKEDKAGEFATILTYKFSSQSPKERIVEFYRTFFNNEGYTETKTYSPDSKIKGPKIVFFFTKPNNVVLLSFQTYSEEGRSTYYIQVNEMHPKEINKITQHGVSPEP